jgi:hypothetical protein
MIFNTDTTDEEKLGYTEWDSFAKAKLSNKGRMSLDILPLPITYRKYSGSRMNK